MSACTAVLTRSPPRAAKVLFFVHVSKIMLFIPEVLETILNLTEEQFVLKKCMNRV